MSDELAKEIAEDIICDFPHLDEVSLCEHEMMKQAIIDILRPHIERHERLRKVAFDAGVSMLRASDYLCDATATDEEKTLRNLAKHSLLENLAALRTAIDEKVVNQPIKEQGQ